MIYVIHKILVLLKNHLNYLKDSIFKLLFSQDIMMENPRPEEENIIKDTGNLFRLKKELNYTTIKDIRNLFRGVKKTKLKIE